MIVKTRYGDVKWQPGNLDNAAKIIFSYEHSATFALCLYLNKQDLTMCYFQNEDGIPEHFFCADNQYWYDILGKHSIYSTKFDNVIDNIDIEEIRQYINPGDEIFAYSVINKYLECTFE
jgi:hypothetical protein